MSSNTTYLSILKPDPADPISITNSMHDMYDTIDALVDGSAAGDLNFKDTRTSQIANTFTVAQIAAGSSVSHRYDFVVNDTIHLNIAAGVTGAPSGTIGYNLPIACTWGSGGHYLGPVSAFDASAGTIFRGVCYLTGTSTIAQFAGATGIWNATIPFVWASGDKLSFQLTYEA